ncbi:glycosyltransferase family 4 protein [Anaerolineales bacterium HSG24]|nr:glycosyltransferase family 4 protein [Anaerolineales bacterium HSG24]
MKTYETTPLRICLLSNNYPPDNIEGVARHTHTMAIGLAKLGHEIHVIKAGKSDCDTFHDNVYVHEVQHAQRRYSNYIKNGYRNIAYRLNYSHKIYELVQSLSINHQIQVVDSPLWLLEGLVTAVNNEIPVVIRLATGMRQIVDINKQTAFETRLISDLETEFLELCHGFSANSNATIQTLKKVYGVDFYSKPHRVIYHGIVPAPAEDVYSLSENPSIEPIILYLGRLEKRKGIPDLFAAIPYVLQEFPKAQFWLAGQDNSDNDGFRKTHGLDYPTYFTKKYPQCVNNVKFIGFVPDNQLKKLFQICNLFVAPSLYESFGLIYIEAMNYGRPVIGCNVGGPTEIIVDGETGYLVPPKSPQTLAHAIIKMLSNPRQMCQMGQAGRQRLLSMFTYIKMAEEFVELYQDLSN